MITLLIVNLISTWLLILLILWRAFGSRLQIRRERSFGRKQVVATWWERPRGVCPNYGRNLFRYTYGRYT